MTILCFPFVGTFYGFLTKVEENGEGVFYLLKPQIGKYGKIKSPIISKIISRFISQKVKEKN